MAKIRTLKGEFFRSADISRSGPWAKLLAAGLICAVADDDGRFKAGLDDLKGEIFTHDAITGEEMTAALRGLVQEDFIRLYFDRGKPFGAVLNWKRHQPVPPTRYKPSEFPAPPNTKHRKHLPTERKQTEANASSRAEYGEEGKGIGKEGKGMSLATNVGELVVLAKTQTPVERVFWAWVNATGRTERTHLDGKRRRLIEVALSGYPEADCVDAVRGWQHSAHHRGENATRTVYNDIGLLLRDAEHIERFRDLARGVGPVVMPAKGKSEQLSDLYRDQAALLRAQGQ